MTAPGDAAIEFVQKAQQWKIQKMTEHDTRKSRASLTDDVVGPRMGTDQLN